MDLVEDLCAFGLSLPGAHRKSPWPDHDDLAVKDKTFAYLPKSGSPFSLSVKLPYTGSEALKLPFAAPAGYGLGKVAPYGELGAYLVRQLKEWVEESYRAQAPRTLVRQLDEQPA